MKSGFAYCQGKVKIYTVKERFKKIPKLMHYEYHAIHLAYVIIPILQVNVA